MSLGIFKYNAPQNAQGFITLVRGRAIAHFTAPHRLEDCSMAKSDAAKEAREQKADAELTPLGRRTLAGFIRRYGEEQGEQKFQNALNAGTIERAKMEAEPAGEADDAAEESTEFTGSKPPKKR